MYVANINRYIYTIDLLMRLFVFFPLWTTNFYKVNPIFLHIAQSMDGCTMSKHNLV